MNRIVSRVDGSLLGAAESVLCVSLRLKQGSIIRVTDGRNLVMEVRAGLLWVTEAGDQHDILLEPGGRFQITAAGLVIVEARMPSEIVLQAPHVPAEPLLSGRVCGFASFLAKPGLVFS